MLSRLDKKIISLISQDIPLVKEPFKNLALKLGIDQGALLARIKSYKKNGILRKFSATLNHRKIGFKHNAMVVWNIPDRILDRAGNLMASLPQVSHCYQRRKLRDWNYNLYSMIHSKTKKECFDTVRNIYKKTGCKDYRVLFSSYEYKKSAAKYFKDEED